MSRPEGPELGALGAIDEPGEEGEPGDEELGGTKRVPPLEGAIEGVLREGPDAPPGLIEEPGEAGRTEGELGRTVGPELREEPKEPELEGRAEGAEPREPWEEEGRAPPPPPLDPREAEGAEPREEPPEPRDPRCASASGAITRKDSASKEMRRVFMVFGSCGSSPRRRSLMRPIRTDWQM